MTNTELIDEYARLRDEFKAKGLGGRIGYGRGYYDRAIAEGRLFGHIMADGHWFTVGTPDALPAAEAKLAEFAARHA